LQADAKIDRDFTMVSEGTPTVADRPIGPVDPPKGVRIGGGVAESNLVTKITPTYPVAAKKAGIQGVVELAVTISKEGVPVDLRVISSPSDDLSESALEAVRQWRYSSTLLNGNPVEVMTTVIVHYTLSK
jgi:protein TonB